MTCREKLSEILQKYHYELGPYQTLSDKAIMELCQAHLLSWIVIESDIFKIEDSILLLQVLKDRYSRPAPTWNQSKPAPSYQDDWKKELIKCHTL